MIKKKDKAPTISAATRTIVAEDVRIENGLFVDESGNIAERIAELLLKPEDVFKVTIKFELPEDESEDTE